MNISKRIAVSSWSLHRLLGVTYPHDLDSTEIGPRQETFGPPKVSLMDLPGLAASQGIHRLEICSFQMPAKDTAYLAELKDALHTANVTLQTLLIEAGDLSDPAAAARDADWISRWVDVAAELGAENARIIAGKQKSTRQALDLAASGLKRIAANNNSSVMLVTENWFDLLPTPYAVNYLLDQTDGQIGLNGDFGNWAGPDKYEALASIFGRASICHAKAGFDGVNLNGDDFGRCLEVAEAAGYAGPYTLIFDSEALNELDGIAIEREFVLERLSTLRVAAQ